MYLDIKTINNVMPKIKGVTFTEFKVDDAMNIVSGEFEGYSAQRLVGIKSLLESQAEYGFSFTAWLYDEPVASFGCAPLWQGVGEMWSVIGETARRYPIATTKIGIAFADMCEIAMGLHRLQITVKTSDNRAISWAKAIGFISEATLKAYSMDKQDYDLMVRRP